MKKKISFPFKLNCAWRGYFLRWEKYSVYFPHRRKKNTKDHVAWAWKFKCLCTTATLYAIVFIFHIYECFCEPFFYVTWFFSVLFSLALALPIFICFSLLTTTSLWKLFGWRKGKKNLKCLFFSCFSFSFCVWIIKGYNNSYKLH